MEPMTDPKPPKSSSPGGTVRFAPPPDHEMAGTHLGTGSANNQTPLHLRLAKGESVLIISVGFCTNF
jgi:hypothetical protein